MADFDGHTPDFRALTDPELPLWRRAASGSSTLQRLMPTLLAADVSSCIRQAQTRHRRNLLETAGLPYKKMPDEHACQQLLDLLPDEADQYTIEFGHLLSTAFTHRFQMIDEERVPSPLPEDPYELLPISAASFATDPPELVTVALTDWLMMPRKQPVSVLVVALLVHLLRSLQLEEWKSSLEDLERDFETRAADLYHDGSSALARRFLSRTREAMDSTLARLEAVGAHATGFHETGLLAPVANDLKELGAQASAEANMIEFIEDTLRRKMGVDLGSDPSLDDIERAIDELENEDAAFVSHPGEILTRLQGPPELEATINQLRSVVQALIDDHEELDEGLAAFAAAVAGKFSNQWAGLEQFAAHHPELARLGFAFAGGAISVAPNQDDDQPEIEVEVDSSPVEAPERPTDRPADLAVERPNHASATKPPDKIRVDPTPQDEGDCPDSDTSLDEQPAGGAERREPHAVLAIDAVEPETSDQGQPDEDHTPQREPRPAEATTGLAEPTKSSNGPDSKADSAATQVSDDVERSRLEQYALDAALMVGDFGLAAHLARYADIPKDATAFRLTALATHAVNATGPCATMFSDQIDALDDDISLAARIVLLPASLRMSLVAPYSGAALIASQTSMALPSLSRFVDATTRASQQGVALIDDVLSIAADLDEADQAIDLALKHLRGFLATAPSHTIKYQRATDTWKTLISPGGQLAECLNLATRTFTNQDEQLSAAKALRSRVAELSRQKARDNVIASADHSKRREPIHSGALERLHQYWAEALELGTAWADAAIAAQQLRVNSEVWQQSTLDALRNTETACRPGLEADLERLQNDRAVPAGAVHAVLEIMGAIRNLLAGERPVVAEANPTELLNASLLTMKDTRLQSDWTVRSEPNDALDQLDAMAGDNMLDALQGSFEARVAEKDHVGTSLIIEYLMDRNSDLATVLAEDRSSELPIARAAVAQSWSAASDQLNADRRLGFVDESTWREWTSQLTEHDPADRDDLDLVEKKIRSILALAAVNRTETIDQFKKQLKLIAADSAAVADALDQISARVEEGDLTTAWEYISLAREGGQIPEQPVDLNDLASFDAKTDSDLATISILSNASRQAIANRQMVGPLDFGSLDNADHETASSGLEAWRRLSRSKDLKGVDWEQVLPPVLELLGVAGGDVRIGSENLAKARDHFWIDVVGFEVDSDPILPAFSPEPTHSTVRKFLVSRGDASVLEGHIARARVSEPIIVLHLGALAPSKRRLFTETFRRVRTTIAVIDDSLLAWIASQPAPRYQHTMRAVLPYVTTNPYMPDAYGLVPETMFYGRTVELDQLLRQRGGTSYLYGGRQLGKSALLRYAKREFERSSNQRAIYLDLKARQVGRPRPPEAIWEELWVALDAEGLVSGEMPARVAERTSQAIHEWLAVEPDRRLLVLLDECDLFIEADTRGHLSVSARLKGLMEDTNRRCKIVFAGLHTVQRFSSVATGSSNTPLAHLGEPLAIGPLDGRHAAELVSRPAQALGYTFESFDLVNRILAHTNRQPALLVIFMHHLIERLNAQPRTRDGSTRIITAGDVDVTWADPTVSSAIRERVSLTLRLDPAYEVIANVVAYNHHQHGDTYRVPVSALRTECSDYWPAGFSGMRTADFTLVADEMIGLGVLVREGNSYMLRSPNVSRLLGSRDEIELRLAEASLIEPTNIFEPTRWRRDMTSSDSQGSEPARSPLTDAQLADLATVESQVRIVVGTKASGLDRVPEILKRAAGHRAVFAQRSIADPNIGSYLRRLGDGRHRVVVIPVDGADLDHCLDVLARARAATDASQHRNPQAGTVSVTFVAHLVTDGAFVRFVAGTALRDEVPVVPTQRWTAEAIANFGRDTGLPFDSPDTAGRVSELTGGWDSLVHDVARRCAQGAPLNTALKKFDAGVLATQLRLEADHILNAAYRAAATFLDGSAELASDVAEYVVLDETNDHTLELALADAVVTQLALLGLLIDEGDEKVRLEPLAARTLGLLGN